MSLEGGSHRAAFPSTVHPSATQALLHDTTDPPHFCAADALSRRILSQLTVSVLAKCQGHGHICLSLSAACPRLLGNTLYPGGSFHKA